jgi:diguanylate cyclase (GGDEF)-like protein
LTKSPSQLSDGNSSNKTLRWNLIGLFLALVVAIGFVLLIETGELVEWLSRNRKSKQFNDTFGHDAGDVVLRSLGSLLLTQLRREDIVCRYGGEEFIVILPDAPLDSARQRGEQLREATKELVVEFRGQALGKITLSIGVATFPQNGTTGSALVEAADAALYQAKKEGRDRIVLA